MLESCVVRCANWRSGDDWQNSYETDSTDLCQPPPQFWLTRQHNPHWFHGCFLKKLSIKFCTPSRLNPAKFFSWFFGMSLQECWVMIARSREIKLWSPLEILSLAWYTLVAVAAWGRNIQYSICFDFSIKLWIGGNSGLVPDPGWSPNSSCEYKRASEASWP